MHLHGCGRWFNALRDTTMTLRRDLPDRRGHPTLRTAGARQGMLQHERSLSPRRRAGASTATRPLRFIFDGKSYEGFAGDTLASALLANGVHLVGRSFKYHRPRGIMAAGSDEPNAPGRQSGSGAALHAQSARHPDRALDGLVAKSQNRWPSLGLDLGAVNDLFVAALPAGFYYKTFMWPKSAWKRLYEPMIRAMAGLGRAPTVARSRPLRATLRSLRRARGGRGSGRPRRRARRRSPARASSCATSRRSSAARCLPKRQPSIDGKPASAWLARCRLRH